MNRILRYLFTLFTRKDVFGAKHAKHLRRLIFNFRNRA